MDDQNIVIKQQNLHLLCMVWAQEAIVTKDDSGYSMTLKNLDRKVFYKAARPKRVQGFIEVKKFMTTWIENNNRFEKEPPEVAIVYSKMKSGADGIAHAIPIVISNPNKEGENSWRFKLTQANEKLLVGHYQDIALFIDWLPTPYCPKPIKLVFPKLFN
jgi:hypothetical protein